MIWYTWYHLLYLSSLCYVAFIVSSICLVFRNLVYLFNTCIYGIKVVKKIKVHNFFYHHHFTLQLSSFPILRIHKHTYVHTHSKLLSSYYSVKLFPFDPNDNPWPKGLASLIKISCIFFMTRSFSKLKTKNTMKVGNAYFPKIKNKNKKVLIDIKLNSNKRTYQHRRINIF